MKKKRFSDEQMVSILRQGAAGGETIGDVCQRHGVSEPTFYVRRTKFGSNPESDVRWLREVEKENQRLKRLVAERDLEVDVMKELVQKKVVGTPARGLAAEFMVSRDVSSRNACELVGISRRWVRYLSWAKDDGLSVRLKALALEHPRYGYRRLWALLRRSGERVNVKRIGRL